MNQEATKKELNSIKKIVEGKMKEKYKHSHIQYWLKKMGRNIFGRNFCPGIYRSLFYYMIFNLESAYYLAYENDKINMEGGGYKDAIGNFSEKSIPDLINETSSANMIYEKGIFEEIKSVSQLIINKLNKKNSAFQRVTTNKFELLFPRVKGKNSLKGNKKYIGEQMVIFSRICLHIEEIALEGNANTDINKDGNPFDFYDQIEKLLKIIEAETIRYRARYKKIYKVFYS